jgi:hypothetical protein
MTTETNVPAQAGDEPMLLPCPFCAGPADWCECKACDRVWCQTCDVMIEFTPPDECDTLDKARAFSTRAWNRRAAPRATADVERDAARFDFMMRVADNPEGAEAMAVEAIGNESMETDRPESIQMRELIDAAIAATKGAKP